MPIRMQMVAARFPSLSIPINCDEETMSYHFTNYRPNDVRCEKNDDADCFLEREKKKKKVSNLVFYTQSIITVISGR